MNLVTTDDEESDFNFFPNFTINYFIETSINRVEQLIKN